MVDGSDFSRFTEIELKAISLLSEDSRLSVSELANRIGVSKATTSRLVKSLRAKGVKFTIDASHGYPRAFIVTRKRHEGECYRLIDGRYMVIVKASDFNNLIKLINDIKDKESVYVALEPASTVTALPRLICDYCGGPINGLPITYKRGRRVYYVCCRTCLRELKRKLHAR